MITQPDDNDAEFVLDHEGCPLLAYQDPGGVWTIGPGFTMGSKIFAAYWLQTRTHALRRGDTISKAEAIKLFRTVLAEEYGVAVAPAIGTDVQHVFGGCTSVSYNAGIGALGWAWAKAIRAGNIEAGANLLLTTAVTVNGKVLHGLQTRRADEAKLISTGDYGFVTLTESTRKPVASAISTAPDAVRQYQGWLKTLGYYAGQPTGVVDALTSGAVKNFQHANGLKVDGVVGPATRATMLRALSTKTRNVAGGTAGGVTGLAGSIIAPFAQNSTLTLVIVAAAVAIAVFIAWELWSHRGKLTGQRTPV